MLLKYWVLENDGQTIFACGETGLADAIKLNINQPAKLIGPNIEFTIWKDSEGTEEWQTVKLVEPDERWVKIIELPALLDMIEMYRQLGNERVKLGVIGEGCETNPLYQQHQGLRGMICRKIESAYFEWRMHSPFELRGDAQPTEWVTYGEEK